MDHPQNEYDRRWGHCLVGRVYAEPPQGETRVEGRAAVVAVEALLPSDALENRDTAVAPEAEVGVIPLVQMLVKDQIEREIAHRDEMQELSRQCDVHALTKS
jgi:hypothetical protein